MTVPPGPPGPPPPGYPPPGQPPGGQPGSPYGPPPGGWGPQYGPPPTKRTSWVKVLLIVGGIIVLLIGVFAACTAFVVKQAVDTARPLFDAGNDYLTAIGSDRLDDAGALRCDKSSIAAAGDADTLDAAGWTGGVNLTGASTGTSGDEVSGTITTRTGTRPITVDLAGSGNDRYCVLGISLSRSSTDGFWPSVAPDASIAAASSCACSAWWTVTAQS